MIESKSFYRRIEAVFDALGETRSRTALAERLGPRLLDELGGPLAVEAVHLYVRRDGEVLLARRWGGSRPDRCTALTGHIEEHRDDTESPWPWIEESAAGRTGAIEVGEGSGPLLMLFAAGSGDLGSAPSRADFVSALNSLVYALRQHLHRRDLENVMEQARTIQLSLLPNGRPTFESFDIFALSVPAERVGGDLYEFLPLDAETLALAVADASGHGLPAALQARDVAVGLRMGVERDLKITRMVEKLNRIIHRSGLVSRFVSMVFGELESNGNFSYINAGHPPPLLLDDRGFRELTVGGPVLGPMPDASYKLGFSHVDRGAALALFSDGVVECAARDGKEFGVEGVCAWMEAWRAGPSEAAVADLIERLAQHRGSRRFEDDVTMLFVRRPE